MQHNISNVIEIIINYWYVYLKNVFQTFLHIKQTNYQTAKNYQYYVFFFFSDIHWQSKISGMFNNLITIKNCPSSKTHGKSCFYEYSLFSIYQWDVKIIYFLVRFPLQKCEEANRNRTWILFMRTRKSFQVVPCQ